jgi:hypothetical protein
MLNLLSILSLVAGLIGAFSIVHVFRSETQRRSSRDAETAAQNVPTSSARKRQPAIAWSALANASPAAYSSSAFGEYCAAICCCTCGGTGS